MRSKAATVFSIVFPRLFKRPIIQPNRRLNANIEALCQSEVRKS
jgi:hypothetical protein